MLEYWRMKKKIYNMTYVLFQKCEEYIEIYVDNKITKLFKEKRNLSIMSLVQKNALKYLFYYIFFT